VYALIAQIARAFSLVAPRASQDGIARGLMESAEARAGTNPEQAQELRAAACAYLRVVR
jgi:hypothetical protein